VQMLAGWLGATTSDASSPAFTRHGHLHRANAATCCRPMRLAFLSPQILIEVMGTFVDWHRDYYRIWAPMN
jgi:hypothetical protein